MSLKHLVRAAVAIGAAAALGLPGAAFAAGGRPPGAGNGGGGGETTAFGNNLSNPVVFASNVGILGAKDDGTSGFSATWTGLRIPPTAAGQFTQSVLWTNVNGTGLSQYVWPQAMEGNSWQATWLANPLKVNQGTVANWGDNILGSNGAVKAFSTNTAIRVEVRPDAAAPATYPAGSVYMPMVNNGGSGSEEKFAAAQNLMAPVTSAILPTVFSGGAYIQLQKVTDNTGATVDGSFAAKTYPVSDTFVSSTEESSGSTGGVAPMRLAGELNASGSVVYGLNLFPTQVPMTPGYYKITFGIDPTFTDNAIGPDDTESSNATLTGVNPADAAPSTEGGSGSTVGRATYDSATQTSSVVFEITSSSTGGSGGAGGRPPGAGNGGGGGETTAFGNNLSNPVLLASNVGILGAQSDGTPWNATTGYSATWTGLRIPPTAAGQFTEPFYWSNVGQDVWPQGLEGNSWQATWLANPLKVNQGTVANWGDNILGSNGAVKGFSTNTAIRVEVRPDAAAPATYPAGSVYMPMVNNGGSGSEEKFAAAQNFMAPVTSPILPTVFSGGAYITLQKVTDNTGASVDEAWGSKTYPVSTTFVSSTEESDGSTGGVAPMRLAGELNASGSVVYGLNLFPTQVPMTPGYYKITFGIDPTFTDNAIGPDDTESSNATLTGVNPADAAPSTEGGSGSTVGRASYNATAHTSSVVFQITSSSTGQRGGGGQGGSGS